MLKHFILRNWWVQNHCIYIYLKPCTCKSFKLHSNTLYRIDYLKVVVHIVTVSNIIHVGQWIFHVTNTLYFWNNVLGKRHILLQRDAKIRDICPGLILLAKIGYQMFFAIVAKEIIERKLPVCQKITNKYRKKSARITNLTRIKKKKTPRRTPKCPQILQKSQI